MEIKLGATVSYFLWSLLAGGVLAFAYDLLRSSRRIFKTSVFGINFEDILFFLLSGIILFWIAYDKNDGRLRFQGFLGVFLGFLVYRIVFQDRVVKIIVWIFEQLLKLLFFLLKIVLFPVRMIYKALAKPFLVIAWYSRQGICRAERVAKTVARRREMLRKCQSGHQDRKKSRSVKTENFR